MLRRHLSLSIAPIVNCLLLRSCPADKKETYKKKKEMYWMYKKVSQSQKIFSVEHFTYFKLPSLFLLVFGSMFDVGPRWQEKGLNRHGPSLGTGVYTLKVGPSFII